MSTTEMNPAYVPLIAEDHDFYLTPTQPRSKCRSVLLYSTVTIAIIMSIAGAFYFLLPGRHSNSSATVTIVNRFPDDISVYQISQNGKERILAHLGPNDALRVYPESEGKCFVRHQEHYIAVEKVHEHGATLVLGDDDSTLVASRSGGKGQTVTFVNDEDEPVVLSWVDFDGATVEMAHVPPHQSYDVTTYVDHVFFISSADDNREMIGQFTIRADVAVIHTKPIIDPQEHAVRVNVENRTPAQVKLMWRDPEGHENVIGVLESDTKTVVDTYVGHELYFLESDGSETRSITIVPSIVLLRAVPNKKH